MKSQILKLGLFILVVTPVFLSADGPKGPREPNDALDPAPPGTRFDPNDLRQYGKNIQRRNERHAELSNEIDQQNRENAEAFEKNKTKLLQDLAERRRKFTDDHNKESERLRRSHGRSGRKEFGSVLSTKVDEHGITTKFTKEQLFLAKTVPSAMVSAPDNKKDEDDENNKFDIELLGGEVGKAQNGFRGLTDDIKQFITDKIGNTQVPATKANWDDLIDQFVSKNVSFATPAPTETTPKVEPSKYQSYKDFIDRDKPLRQAYKVLRVAPESDMTAGLRSGEAPSRIPMSDTTSGETYHPRSGGQPTTGTGAPAPREDLTVSALLDRADKATELGNQQSQETYRFLYNKYKEDNKKLTDRLTEQNSAFDRELADINDQKAPKPIKTPDKEEIEKPRPVANQQNGGASGGGASASGSSTGGAGSSGGTPSMPNTELASASLPDGGTGGSPSIPAINGGQFGSDINFPGSKPTKLIVPEGAHPAAKELTSAPTTPEESTLRNMLQQAGEGKLGNIFQASRGKEGSAEGPTGSDKQPGAKPGANGGPQIDPPSNPSGTQYKAKEKSMTQVGEPTYDAAAGADGAAVEGEETTGDPTVDALKARNRLLGEVFYGDEECKDIPTLFCHTIVAECDDSSNKHAICRHKRVESYAKGKKKKSAEAQEEAQFAAAKKKDDKALRMPASLNF